MEYYNIYNDAYFSAMQSGASEEDARYYAEQAQESMQFASMYY